MADVMDDEAPAGERERLWALIDQTPWLIWQLLTKRPQRYPRYLPAQFKHRNVWLGATAENQEHYDRRWPILREVAKVRRLIAFISYEPAIGPLTMMNGNGRPDQIICGGESGNNARDFDQSWAEKLSVECVQSRVAFFMKQMSARTPAQGSALIPPHLLIRNFPKAASDGN